jgi:hypothetical protein
MLVKDLIKELQKLEPDRLVILSSDEEGNSFSPASEDYSLGNYADREFGLEKLTEENKKLGFTDEDILPGQKAVCLYPIH